MRYIIVFLLGCIGTYLALAWVNFDMGLIAWPGTDGQGIHLIILTSGLGVIWVYAVIKGDL